ncbi:vomeronasal type-2 receptor 26-like [Spea bombifrons]|uniref:vomeronasal type-2 receptor 26-like n=1 Tax=Spea bombifrons TaxID=233779 RepID=UPI00234BB023|nr:vomeronasal type-2 receptor 26-like [Spea bombifrons]
MLLSLNMTAMDLNQEKIDYKTKLYSYVRKVHYTDQFGTEKFFNERGEIPSVYSLTNWKLVTKLRNVELEKRIIGKVYKAPSDIWHFHIFERQIIWKNGKLLLFLSQVPKARCNDYCLPGSRKAPGRGYLTCCYRCVPCSEGEVSNEIDSNNCQKCPDNKWPDQKRMKCIPKKYDFLSYEDDIMAPIFSLFSALFSVITSFSLGIFIAFRDTPIVRANNRNLSFLLLVSLMLSFLCVFLFLGRPVDITCRLRQTAFGVIFSVAVSSLLAKTIMVFIAFNATKPGSSWRKWMKVKVSNSVVLACSSIQILINVVWLSISPPFQELDMHTSPGKIIVQCNEGSVIFFYSVLGYMGLLAAVSFIMAFLARSLPDSFNEAKHITFSMLVFCSVWIAMIPAYLSTKGKNMVAVEIFAILASSAGILGCIFFPKCYIVLIKPEMNTKTHLIQKRNKQPVSHIFLVKGSKR